MRNHLSVLAMPILFSLVLLIAPGTFIRADGGFIPPNLEKDVFQPHQKAVILYRDGTEDLIIKTTYVGDLDDFAWVIPVPAVPTIDEQSQDLDFIFSDLSTLTFSDVFNEPPVGEGYRDVDVVEEADVGIYQVTVLSSSTPESLVTWLTDHGYVLPAEAKPVVSYYVTRGWYFVAARVQPEGERQYGRLHPIRLTFQSDEIIYPMRLTSVSAADDLEVLTYVFYDTQVSMPGGTVEYADTVIRTDIEQSYPRIYDLLSGDSFVTKVRKTYATGNDITDDIYFSAVDAGSNTDLRCFIASAVFDENTYVGELCSLRTFRDRFLLSSQPGQLAVAVYYAASPPVARLIGSCPILKQTVRVLLKRGISMAVAICSPE